MSEKTAEESVETTPVPATSAEQPDYAHEIKRLEKRIGKLEKKLATNERLARTLASTLATQLVATDAVTAVVRRSLQTDAGVQRELSAAIRLYDKHKVRRWFSGFFSIILWITSVAAAAVAGAAIYWLFAGQ